MKTIASTRQLEAINSIHGSGVGKLFEEYLQDLLSVMNKQAAFTNDTEEKLHLSGGARQIYKLLELFESANDTLKVRKTTK